eukprot:3938629-Rhodomonas_salina.4
MSDSCLAMVGIDSVDLLRKAAFFSASLLTLRITGVEGQEPYFHGSDEVEAIEDLLEAMS